MPHILNKSLYCLYFEKPAHWSTVNTKINAYKCIWTTCCELKFQFKTVLFGNLKKPNSHYP